MYDIGIILLQLIGKMQFGTCQRMHVVVSLEHHQREFFNCAFALVEIGTENVWMACC